MKILAFALLIPILAALFYAAYNTASPVVSTAHCFWASSWCVGVDLQTLLGTDQAGAQTGSTSSCGG